MIRRNWTVDPACYFCDKEENVTHLLFQCSINQAVWAIVAHSIGATNIPSSFENCWEWCNRWFAFWQEISCHWDCCHMLGDMEDKE
jgi:hypothetical protein